MYSLNGFSYILTWGSWLTVKVLVYYVVCFEIITFISTIKRLESWAKMWINVYLTWDNFCHEMQY